MGLAQRPKLRPGGRQVVEHREAADRVEGVVGEGQLRRIADLHRHVRARELVRETRGGVGVELERDEMRHAVAEPARRGAGAGAELEHLVPEIETGRHGLEHLRLHELGPLRRAAKGVVLVHGGRH